MSWTVNDEGEHHEHKSTKTLRYDASLPLDQTVNIIYIVYMIDQSNECGKDFHVLIIVAGM